LHADDQRKGSQPALVWAAPTRRFASGISHPPMGRRLIER